MGLAKSDWQPIRAAYEAGRHAFQPTESGWQARNPGQQWLTTFDKRGFVARPKDGGWQWGLELQNYGFGENQRAISGVPSVKAAGQRLTYSWDANVQEWFVNDQRGLEHGFTIVERPLSPSEGERDGARGKPLSFTLAVRGGLRPHVTTDALGVEFRDGAGATVLTYSGLKVWDADGQVLPSRFETVDGRARHSVRAAGEAEDVIASSRRAEDCEPCLRLLVDERGARYPLTIDPIAQQAYLKASNTGANDRFGLSVAVSGDTVVVGASDEDSNATGVNGNQADNSASGSGATYVFTTAAVQSPMINRQSLTVLGNGSFQFRFTNVDNTTFSVLATTNVSLPSTNWTVLGTATNVGGGIYQFTDPATSGLPRRFYQLRGP